DSHLRRVALATLRDLLGNLVIHTHHTERTKRLAMRRVDKSTLGPHVQRVPNATARLEYLGSLHCHWHDTVWAIEHRVFDIKLKARRQSSAALCSHVEQSRAIRQE